MRDELQDRIVALLRSVRRNPQLDLEHTAQEIIRMATEIRSAGRGKRLPCVRQFTPKLGANKQGVFVGTKEMSDQGDEMLAHRSKPSPAKKKGKK